MRKTLLDLEAQAKHERAAIEGLRALTGKPVQLPTPEIILAQCERFEAIVESDVLRAREALRALFVGEGLQMRPEADGRYLAEGRFDPLALFRIDLSDPKDKTTKTPVLDQGLRLRLNSLSSDCCAGRN